MRWNNWVNLILGLLLIISPFVFGFADVTAAMWTAIIIGILVAIVSLVPAFTRQAL